FCRMLWVPSALTTVNPYSPKMGPQIGEQAEMHDRHDLKWHGRQLKLKSRVLATVEPDGRYVGMFRVRLPSGRLTDMVNLARAKGAAMELAVNQLNRGASRPDRASPMRISARPQNDDTVYG